MAHTATATHLPTHSGKITNGRVADRGEKITCKSCRRLIAQAVELLPVYAQAVAEDAAGNFPPAYANRSADVEMRHLEQMARNAWHYALIATFEGARV